MRTETRQAHWETTYVAKRESEVSWFQALPEPSLELIDQVGATTSSAIIDVGGGASRLMDNLLARGFQHLTVLDISSSALETAKTRIGSQAERVRWVVADVTEWQPPQGYDLWHDRAVFHFLTDATDRVAYVSRLMRSLKPGGHAIIGTFATDGPEKCSGLPVIRYAAGSLGQTIGPAFDLVRTQRHEHITPWGTQQAFQFSVFRRLPD